MKKFHVTHNGQRTELSSIDIALFGHLYGIELAAQLINCNKSTIYRSMREKPPTQNKIAIRLSEICNDALVTRALELLNLLKKETSSSAVISQTAY